MIPKILDVFADIFECLSLKGLRLHLAMLCNIHLYMLQGIAKTSLHGHNELRKASLCY